MVNATRKVGQLYELEGIHIGDRSAAGDCNGGANGSESNGNADTKSTWANKWTKEVLRLWEWQWRDHGPDDDWDKAEEMLTAMVNGHAQSH